MQENQNPISMEDIIQIATSPVGQQLIRILQQTGGPDLKHAAQQAAAGDYESAKQNLSGVLQNPEVKKLLDAIGRK